jgi:hypothetical protein
MICEEEKMNLRLKVMAGFFGLAAVLAISQSVQAATVVVNFDGLNGASQEGVGNYYNGGFGSLGSGPGPNFGITFSSNAIVCVEAPFPGACNTAEAPSAPNILFFLTGSAATMDVPAGFDTGFSFFYSAITNPAFINVFSGLDGTGTLLATLNLPTTPLDGNAGCLGEAFCPYEPIGVSFAGTAMSVEFGGVENQVGFDNITLGASVPVGAPEPGSIAMLASGLALLALAVRYKKQNGTAV